MVRYQLTADTGTVDGKRKELRRRYRTEREARAALAEIQGQVNAGSYVQPSDLTVEQACADSLRSRHKIRPTTAAGYEYVLQPVRSELGGLPVQDLTRRHLDELIVELRAGSLTRPTGKPRKAWSAAPSSRRGALRAAETSPLWLTGSQGGRAPSRRSPSNKSRPC